MYGSTRQRDAAVYPLQRYYFYTTNLTDFVRDELCVVSVICRPADSRAWCENGIPTYIDHYICYILYDIYTRYYISAGVRSRVRAPKRHAGQGRSISLSRAPESIFFNRFLFYFFFFLFFFFAKRDHTFFGAV